MAGFWDGIKSPAKVFDFWSISKIKSVNETGVVQSLLENLSLEASTLRTTGHDDPPDCTLQVDTDTDTVGIEVVALVDHTAREMSARARGNKTVEFYAEWTAQSLRAEIDRLVAEKTQKLRNGAISGKAASRLKRFWLAIHSDEMTLTSPNVKNFVEGWQPVDNYFEHIYLILSYEPGRAEIGYPCFKLK